MSRRIWALLLTALMIASAAVALAPAVHGSTPTGSTGVAKTSAAGASPGAGPGFEIFNAYGVTTDTFYLGEIGDGTLGFYVDDALDHSVNVTITDPNATRDNVPNPAFSYQATMNTTTHSFDSLTADVSYTFPSLAYGGVWVVNFSAPVAGYVTQNVTLVAYSTTLADSVGDGASILPGSSFSLIWHAFQTANGGTALYTHATSVVLSGHYDDNGTESNLFPGGTLQLPVGSWGQWNGTVPLNTSAQSELRFQVWVITEVNGVVAENESSAVVRVEVGGLTITDDSDVTLFPGYCLDDGYTYLPISGLVSACVQAGSLYGADQFTPIAGLPVTISYWNGTATVTPAGGASTSGTTNVSGIVEVPFNVSSPPFITEFQYPYLDSVNFTVTVPGATAALGPWIQWANLSFTLTPYSFQSGVVSLSLDHTEYYAGTTATATWSIGSTDTAATGPITANYWTARAADSSALYASGTFSGTAQSGTFTIPITTAMWGHELLVEVYASNATTYWTAESEAIVVAPSLLLSPSSLFYTEGSTTHVVALLNALPGATIGYQTEEFWANSEAIVATGTVANGSSIPVPIPSANPPLDVEVDAWASTGGQIVTSNYVELALATGYGVTLGVVTVSSYSDGSFQPGQTVTLSYAITSIDQTAMPQTFEFYVYATGYPYAQYVDTTHATGTVAFTIPSSAPAGFLTVDLQIYGTLTAGYCLPANTCSGTTALLVNPSPSVLSLELGAGSGLTVGWLILLVIVILVAIVLYVVLRRRGGSRTTGGGTNTATPMSPPAPAPSTPPATEWQEPTPAAPPAPPPPSGDAPPPLPPPGAA
jgi:hypothetical protein